MPLAPGAQLLHFAILDRLGAGAMGEVWRARDTRLGRDVAIKVLPAQFAEEEERLRRFEREARALAALNHPNVAQIFGVDQDAGLYFLVLELVPGETLEERLGRGALPVNEALDVARQIAEGLEAAHEAGVIHRDLKPANVRVTPDGRVKVLDFGLAKAARDEGNGNSSTDSVLSTEAGRLLGTPTYMAPEQARGKAIDRRVDVWAFGCVLFECLTAKRAFVGETLTDVLGAVLHATADMDALPRDTPRRVRALIESCFVKDPRRRLRDIGQARVELERCLAEGGADDARADDGGASDSALGGRAATDARRRASGSWLALGALVMAALGAALWSTFAPKPESSAALTCVSVVTPPETTFLGMLLTSDERTLVAFGRPRTPSGAADAATRAYVRRMDGFEFEALAGTEGCEAGVPTRDGRGLLFTASVGPGSTERRLAYVPLDGSAPPTTVAVWQQHWGMFVELESGDIVVADGPMSCTRLDRATGKLDLSVRLDAGRSEVQRFELQEALPDDRGVLVNVVSYGERGFQFGVGVLDPATGRVDVVVEDGGNARYSPTGHLLFARGATILAAPFDMAERRVRGAPVAVWGGALSNNRAFPALFQVTASGTLAFPPAWGEFAHELALLHEDGRVEAWSKERLDLGGPLSVSPDGRSVLVQRLNVRGIDEFLVSDTDEPNFEKLGTETNADSFFGTWSPDGRRVAYFRSGRDGRDGVYVRDVASGEQTLVFSVAEAEVEGAFATGWLADASALLVTQFVGNSTRLVLVPLEGAADDRSRLKQLLPDDFGRRFARPSRDGRFVAYQSDETGALHTFVAPLASDGTIGRAVRVRTNGSKWHAWGHARSGDGATLYVQDSIDRLQKVSVTTAPELSLGEPVEIANLGALRVDHWDVLSEGTFLVGAKSEGVGEVRRFDLVYGWAGQLGEMVEAVR